MQNYDKKPSFYWFQWILFALVLIGALVWISIFVQNISIPINYRESFTVIVLRMTIIGHIAIVAFVLCLIAFRDNNGCQIFWFILYIIAYLILFLGIIALGREYSQCNREPYNLCNDLKLCCKNEIHTNPTFNCPNTLDCPISFEVKPNDDFLGLFWLHFILFVFQCVWLAVYLYFLVTKKEEEEEEEKQEGGRGGEEGEEKKEGVEEEEEEKKQQLEQEVVRQVYEKSGRPIHGLKKRK